MVNRNTAITIVHSQAIYDYLTTQGVDFDRVNKCTQLNEDVLFIYSIQWSEVVGMLGLSPVFFDSEKYKGNFGCWFDDGEKEVRVKDNDYTSYNINELYENRTGKYDPIDEL
jgi:hypothetical protein